MSSYLLFNDFIFANHCSAFQFFSIRLLLYIRVILGDVFVRKIYLDKFIEGMFIYGMFIILNIYMYISGKRHRESNDFKGFVQSQLKK